MGGPGSGRWGQRGRGTVQDCLKFPISCLMPQFHAEQPVTPILSIHYGWLDEPIAVMVAAVFNLDDRDPFVYLAYPASLNNPMLPDDERIQYAVRLQGIQPHFGGRRWSFICPATDRGVCQRRVFNLYLPRGGRLFACRHCLNLAYASSQNSGSASVHTPRGWRRFYQETLEAGCRPCTRAGR
jgi:hypothetical protein